MYLFNVIIEDEEVKRRARGKRESDRDENRMEQEDKKRRGNTGGTVQSRSGAVDMIILRVSEL